MTQAKNAAQPETTEDTNPSDGDAVDATRESRLNAIRQIIDNAKLVTIEDVEKIEATDLCDPYLTELELKSIYALVAYVANNRGVSEDTVVFEASDAFGFNDITKIRSRDYKAVVQHLVDACDEEKMTAN